MKRTIFILLILLLEITGVKSQDFWQPFSSPFSSGDISSIVELANNDILVSSSLGLFTSSDNGENWNIIVNQNAPSNLDIKLHPDGDIFGVNGALYHSTNNGDTWSCLIDTAVYINVININKTGDIYIATENNGLYRSTNKGANWSKIGFEDKQVEVIAFHPNGDIYVGLYSGGLYCSKDTAASWDYVYNINSIRDIIINDSNGYIYVGSYNSGIYLSIDSGITWSNPLEERTVLSLALNKSGQLFAGEGVFIWISTDSGNTWSYISNSPQMTTSILVHSSGDIFTGGYGSSYACLYRSTDNGLSWEENGLPVGSEIRINSDGSMFVGTDYCLFRSVDNGDSWVLSKSGYYIRLLGENINGDIYASYGKDMYSSYGAYLIRSTDNGNTWTNISIPPKRSVRRMGFSPNGDIIICGDNIYFSSDTGSTWISGGGKGKGKGKGSLRPLAVHPSGKIFTAHNSYYARILMSEDSCRTWTEVLTTSMNIYDMVVHPIGGIFASTQSEGVFYSADTGKTWVNTSLTNRIIDLDIDAHGNIYALGENLYSSIDNGITWHEIVKTGIPFYDGSSYFINNIESDENGFLYTATTRPACGIYRTTSSFISDYDFSFIISCYGDSSYFEILENNTSIDSITSFNWDFGDSLSGPDNYSTIPSPSHLFSSPGIFAVNLTVEYNSVFGNKSVTISNTITISRLEFNTNYTEPSSYGVCDGYSEVTAVEGTSPFAYLWSTGDTVSSIDNLCDAVYYITVSDANGCTEMDTISSDNPIFNEDSLEYIFHTSIDTCIFNDTVILDSARVTNISIVNDSIMLVDWSIWQLGNEITLDSVEYEYIDGADTSLIYLTILCDTTKSILTYKFADIYIIKHISSISDIKKDDYSITIYPNPTESRVNIKFSNPTNKELFVELIDVRGQVIYTKEVQSSTILQIDLSSYAKGVYFVKVRGEGLTKVEKVIFY